MKRGSCHLDARPRSVSKFGYTPKCTDWYSFSRFQKSFPNVWRHVFKQSNWVQWHERFHEVSNKLQRLAVLHSWCFPLPVRVILGHIQFLQGTSCLLLGVLGRLFMPEISCPPTRPTLFFGFNQQPRVFTATSSKISKGYGHSEHRFGTMFHIPSIIVMQSMSSQCQE